MNRSIDQWIYNLNNRQPTQTHIYVQINNNNHDHNDRSPHFVSQCVLNLKFKSRDGHSKTGRVF